VWQGSAGDRRPYADQVGLWEVSRAVRRQSELENLGPIRVP
jgi:hypothetical protein